jgi:hypothetical protein
MCACNAPWYVKSVFGVICEIARVRIFIDGERAPIGLDFGYFMSDISTFYGHSGPDARGPMVASRAPSVHEAQEATVQPGGGCSSCAFPI